MPNDELIEYIYKEQGGYGNIVPKMSPRDYIMSIAKELNLNMKYGLLMLIETKVGPKPYITAAGLREATSHLIKRLTPQCIDYDKQNFPPKWVVYRTEVETLDGRVFSAEGSYDITEIKGNQPVSLHLIRSKAETRATSRALRNLLKVGLDIYDDLPEDVKSKEIKVDSTVPQPQQVQMPEPIPNTEDLHPDAINVEIEPHEEPKPKPKPEPVPQQQSQKFELEQILSLNLEDIIPGYKEQNVSQKTEQQQQTESAEPSLKREVKMVVVSDIENFEGIDYLVPFLKELESKNANVVPPIGGLIQEIGKRTDLCKYLWQWYKALKMQKYLDFKINPELDPKKTSPPIILYEQFTKSFVDLIPNKEGAERWIDLVSEKEVDYIHAYMFYFLYTLYYHHVIAERANEYPQKSIINRLISVGFVRKWVIDVFKVQEPLELPDGG